LCLNYYELQHFFVMLAIIRSSLSQRNSPDAPDTLMKHYMDTKYSSFRERFVRDTLSPVGLVWGCVYGSLLLVMLVASSVSSTGTPSLYICMSCCGHCCPTLPTILCAVWTSRLGDIFDMENYEEKEKTL